MGLDSFKSKNSKDRKKEYTDEELLNSLKRFKEEHGHINSQDYNQDNNYPSHTIIRNRFGTWNNALRKAGLTVTRKSNISEWEVYYDMLKAAERYGEKLEQSDINKDDELINIGTVRRKTGMTFNEVKRKLGLDVNRKQNLKRSDIIHELEKLEEKGLLLSEENVNYYCSFSDGAVIKYGEGSFVKGLEELGFDVSHKQKLKKKTTDSSSNSSKARRWLNDCNSYDSEADAYIYVLKLYTEESDIYYYVGKVNNDKSIHHRISQHIGSKGSFKKHDLDIRNIELHDIDSINSEGESIDRKISKLERTKFCEVVLDNNTKNVLGGY